MAQNIEYYRALVTDCLKKAGSYNKALNIQIQALASAMRALAIADEEIDALDSPVVLEKTRYGEKMAPHPVFKIRKDANDNVVRQMKEIGLSSKQLSFASDEDPMVKLTKKVINSAK